MKADINIPEFNNEMAVQTPTVSVSFPPEPIVSTDPVQEQAGMTLLDEPQEATVASGWVQPEETEELVDWSTLSEVELLKAKKQLEADIIKQLSTVFDPEIPVNIYELGLIYEVRIDNERKVVVQMTLTSPACPVAGSLPLEVEEKTLAVPGVLSARAELVWDPAWTPDMMSEAAKLELGFF